MARSRTSSPLLAVLAYEALTGGTADEAAELADRALHEGGLLAALPIEHPSVFFSISTLIATDRREQAERCLDAAAASAVSSGSLRAYAAVTCLRGRAGYRWGRINEAESEARTAITLIVEHDWTVGKALGAAALADALVERGELERAKEVLDLVDPAQEDDDSHGFQQWRETHARLMLNLGSPEKTLEAARACERWESHWGTHNPVFSQCPWRSTAALAYLALDDTDAAVASALEALEITEAFGDPHSAGVAMRVAGMVHEGDKRLDYLRGAVDVLAQSNSRLAHARALVDLGSSLRIAGRRRDARKPLAAGLELAQECGGTALENRASEELRISGARPRARFSTGVDSLTPSELRVAGMAAEGRSNPEIAQSLFVTRKTVEMHLSQRVPQARRRRARGPRRGARRSAIER